MKTQLKHELQWCLVVVVGLFFAACRTQQTTVNTADLAGVYALVSVDGKPVQASVSHEGAMLEVRSGTFTISADGTCSSRIIMVPPSGTEVIREVNATCTKDGSNLNMQWKGAGRTVGTFQGNTFTMNNEGMIFLYMK